MASVLRAQIAYGNEDVAHCDASNGDAPRTIRKTATRAHRSGMPAAAATDGSDHAGVTPSNCNGEAIRATCGIVISSSHPTAAVARDAKTAVAHAIVDMPMNATQVPAAPDAKCRP